MFYRDMLSSQLDSYVPLNSININADYSIDINADHCININADHSIDINADHTIDIKTILFRKRTTASLVYVDNLELKLTKKISYKFWKKT